MQLTNLSQIPLTKIQGVFFHPRKWVEEFGLSPEPIYFDRETSVESGEGYLILARASAHVEGSYIGCRGLISYGHLIETVNVFQHAAKLIREEYKCAN